MLPDFGWSGHVTSIFWAVASKRARALCSNKKKINQTKKEQIYFCRRSPTFILIPARMWVLRDQTQPELFSRENEKEGNKVLLVPGRRDNFQPLPSLLRDKTKPGLFSREEEEAENKVWSPWASGQFPHPSPPYCVTGPEQGYSLVRRKKQEQTLESLGVGTTSPPLPSLLRDQTQPGLFSREKEESGNKVWSPWGRDKFPTPPLPAA